MIHFLCLRMTSFLLSKESSQSKKYPSISKLTSSGEIIGLPQCPLYSWLWQPCKHTQSQRCIFHLMLFLLWAPLIPSQNLFFFTVKYILFGGGWWVPRDQVPILPVIPFRFPRLFKMKCSNFGKGDAPYFMVTRGNFDVEPTLDTLTVLDDICCCFSSSPRRMLGSIRVV